MKLTRFHALKILEWCQREYGESKYNKGYLTLEFRAPSEITGYVLGYYDDIENMIHINSKDHEDLEDLCKTVIEEYSHYLNNDKEYQKLFEKYDYDTHPHEIQSKRLAEKDYLRCLSDLKESYKQFQ
jgi:Zn-dependent peptidase ImmA (M78 family)